MYVSVLKVPLRDEPIVGFLVPLFHVSNRLEITLQHSFLPCGLRLFSLVYILFCPLFSAGRRARFS